MGTVWGSLFWKTIPKQGSVSGMPYVFSGTVSAEIVVLFLGLEKKIVDSGLLAPAFYLWSKSTY